MKIICVLQGETCAVCDNITEARGLIGQWIEEGFCENEIDVYVASARVDFTVEKTVSATVTFKDWLGHV